METKTFEKIVERHFKKAAEIVQHYNNETECERGKIIQIQPTDAIPIELVELCAVVERDARTAAESFLPTFIKRNSWWLFHHNGAVKLMLKTGDGLFIYKCLQKFEVESSETAANDDDTEKLFATYHNGDGEQSAAFRKIFDELGAGLISFEVDDNGRLQFYVESDKTGIVYHVVPYRKGVRVFTC